MEPNHILWQGRCAFNKLCKETLKHEAIDAYRAAKRQQKYITTFSDLSPAEEAMLYTYDEYFADDANERTFWIKGKEITEKSLIEALDSLSEEGRDAILLYYFFGMKDAEIAKIRSVSRSTVQYRRKKAFELLKVIFGGKHS